MRTATDCLPPQARYFPVDDAPYRLSAGLRKLGSDFGNGAADAHVVQIDEKYFEYRTNKLAARRERLGKYFAAHEFLTETESSICGLLSQLLLKEYPQYFFRRNLDSNCWQLHCNLTEEVLHFEQGNYLPRLSTVQADPPYVSSLDALVCQMPEDLAVTLRNDERDWLAAVHLCAPGHWSAEEKIGRNFGEVHAPIPLIDPIVRASASLVRAMVEKGPMVRFVWGFGTDCRLNHHPEPPPGWTPEMWRGRRFQSDAEGECPFWLRVERQVILGMPEVNASLFFIRVSHIDGNEIRQNSDERRRLVQALSTMDDATRRYKGLSESMDDLLNWLSN
ncbi:heme-dependent oxidative N-demethylase subunit alpha family protein [Planctomicrobium piriforme]|uniref:DUF3445 domain-containing protein n=1 Tax=Planctomicrobium piriforme TaxID=1576369 RepID=A0A1I3QBP9_9PLAN|nr:heme-dependent oxidative N-demethylase subunit alpha family protein [Planctomicrobium piriforme]SFJ31105.1 Protein of unknown function [Planctomicrobium piriforme]